MTLAEEARAFRNASDEDYADLLNGRITLVELVAKNMPRIAEQIAEDVLKLEYGDWTDELSGETILQRIIDDADDQTARDLLNVIEDAVREARA